MNLFGADNLLRSICVSVAVAILTAIAVFILSYLLVPVEKIEVKGERMLPEKAVKQTVPDHASLITLNSWTLERSLKSNLWVEGISVSRDWGSDIVVVQVEERRPVLSADLGGRERFFAADGVELPGSGGVEVETFELDEDRLREVVGAIKVLESSGVELQSVESVGSGGVRATMGDRVVRFSGKVGAEQARAIEEIIAENPKAGVFDLRYSDRVVVGGLREGRANAAPDG